MLKRTLTVITAAFVSVLFMTASVNAQSNDSNQKTSSKSHSRVTTQVKKPDQSAISKQKYQKVRNQLRQIGMKYQKKIKKAQSQMQQADKQSQKQDFKKKMKNLRTQAITQMKQVMKNNNISQKQYRQAAMKYRKSASQKSRQNNGSSQ